CIALTLLLDGVGLRWFDEQQFIDARSFFFPEQRNLWTNIAPATALCNVAFLQTLYCTSVGSNASLWSLSNEAMYYAFWLCLVMGLERRLWWLGALGIAAVYATAPMANIGYVICFGIWAAGALVFAFERHKIAMTALLGGAFIAW